MELSNLSNVFISPSVQEFNRFSGGGNEEYYMNLIADELVPLLSEKGISIERNSPDDTLSGIIRQSNSTNRNLHLAIHSNAGGGEYAGRTMGAEIYYYPYSEQGKKAAEITAASFNYSCSPKARTAFIIIAHSRRFFSSWHDILCADLISPMYW